MRVSRKYVLFILNDYFSRVMRDMKKELQVRTQQLFYPSSSSFSMFIPCISRFSLSYDDDDSIFSLYKRDHA